MRRPGPARPFRVVVSICLAAAAGLGAQRDPLPFSLPDADRFIQKVNGILDYADLPRAAIRRRPSLQTVIREPEVNAWLRFRIRDELPAGVVDPVVLALGDGRLFGRAIVDLDAVRRSRERSLVDPMRYLSGRVPVTAMGLLTTRSGSGWFTLESATVSGIRIPAALLQELVTFYTRTPSAPGGVDLAAPFVLPVGIREIRVHAGQAIVLQ